MCCDSWGCKESDTAWVGKIPWRSARQPTSVFLPGKFHEWRNLVDYCPWDHKELDMTEQLHFTLPGHGN